MDDPVLDNLIELTILATYENRPLFPDILKEPIFYRKYFKRWVSEGLEERRASMPKSDLNKS